LFDEESRLAILAPLTGVAGVEGVGVDGREDEGAAGDLLREIRSQRKSLIRQEQSAAMGEDVGPRTGPAGRRLPTVPGIISLDTARISNPWRC
jgi:hypothetical protein